MRFRQRYWRSSLAVAGLALGLAVPVSASWAAEGPASGDRIEKAPAELEGVDVTEKQLAQVPLEVPFADETGAPVTLRDFFQDGRPVLLTFNYSDCPMLCSVQLGGLVDALSKLKWTAGKEFRVLTIGLDPNETHRRAFETKMRYLERYDRPDADLGWSFLTGTSEHIAAVAEAVGFGYRFHPERSEYLHPAALMLLTPAGTVSGYLYGVSYEPGELQSALETAAVGGTSDAVRKFLLSCFHYDAPTGFAAVAFKVMRYGGLLFVVGLVTAFGVMTTRRTRAHGSTPAGE